MYWDSVLTVYLIFTAVLQLWFLPITNFWFYIILVNNVSNNKNVMNLRLEINAHLKSGHIGIPSSLIIFFQRNSLFYLF